MTADRPRTTGDNGNARPSSGVSATTTSLGSGASGAYAQVAALLHEARGAAPDEVGSFLAERAAEFGMRDLSVYVTDYEQHDLVPIAGSRAADRLSLDDTIGGRGFTTATQLEDPTEGGVRVWSVVVDGAARLGMMSVTFDDVDDEARSLADSLAGVVAALLVTRGQCTDAYTTIRRSQSVDLATEMQWQLLPPLSLDSGRVSIAGFIQPAYSMGGDSFDYAINGNTLDFAVFDAMGHGLDSAQLAHLAIMSYRHSRRAGLDLTETFKALDGVVAETWHGDRFLTCLLGRIDLLNGDLTWVNVGHPLPIMVRADGTMVPLACEPTIPAGLGGPLVEVAHDILGPGDRLCCITDGVIDAHHPGGEDFGAERFEAVLANRTEAKLDIMETVRQISHLVRDHHGYLSDDTTIFLVEFH